MGRLGGRRIPSGGGRRCVVEVDMGARTCVDWGIFCKDAEIVEDAIATVLELGEDANPEFEEEIVERLVDGIVSILCVLPIVRFTGGGTISSTCMEKDSFSVGERDVS